MTKQSNTQAPDAPTKVMPAEWQQAYLASASAVGTSWLDFLGGRFHAYAHAIDDISHCHDLNEAWRVQAAFGQETVKAYGEQAAKLGSMMLKATNGDAGSTSK
jgi:hypothetical protein